MAFVLWPDVSKVRSLFKESKDQNILLRGSKLRVFAFCLYKQNFLKFYTFLKYLADFEKTNADTTRLVCIQDISQSEAAYLRQALRNIGRVMNYQPLLNKVFVEFLSSFDADRLGIWFSFLKPRFSYSVYRMGMPCAHKATVSSTLPPQALSDRDVTIAGACPPTSVTGIPVGTVAPFWVTMTTSPYVYPTGTLWFNVPAFHTVSARSQIQHLEPVRSKHLKVVMLTGLPLDTYTQEDVAKLVWKYFPEQNLASLDNNVMVLPLQRRAFVYFNSWEACLSFLKSHIRTPLCMRNYKLSIHYVLYNIFLNTDEETLYRVLMKWSNIYVPYLKSLEERLLCVEVSGGGSHLVSAIIKRVASIATFVSFLPLANRIYIEMAESSGVTKVVEAMSVSKPSEQCEPWEQFGRVESLKSRKLRLQDSKRTAVNLDLSTVGVCSESTAAKEAPKTGSDPAELGSLVLDPAAATGLSSTAMEEEGRDTEVPVCSIVNPKTDLGTAEEKKEESGSSCSPSPTSLAQPENTDLPPIDSSSFRVLKEAIHLYKSSRDKEVQEDTKEVPSSEVCDEPDLNFEDLITIDEISEDEEDKDVSSSSKTTSRDSEGSSTASSEASKPTSSSSRSTDTSPSSTENQKHPPEPKKSQINPSSASKTSPFVPSSKSVEPSVSPGLKAQPIRAKTPNRASQALPTGRVTRSSAAGLHTSVETPQSHQKEGEPFGGAVAEVDHTASAESSTETSEIRPPSPPVQKLETTQPTQRLETEFKNEILDVKTEKEKDEGKSTEVTEKSKEVVSSPDEQINEESNKETQKAGSEKDQVSHNECLHVSSEVNEEETGSEIKINTEDESATAQTEQCSPLKPDQAMEENQNVPVKQDGSQTEDRETVKVSEDPFQDESVPKRSARRSSRGTKDLKTTQDKVTIVTRSTRGRRSMTAEQSEDKEKEKETPMRPGRTLGRNEQELNTEDTLEVEDITPTNKTNTVGDTNEPKTSLEVSGESEGETKEAAKPRKRGRPRKTTVVASPVLNKQRAELVEPEAKRSRSQSPCVTADFKLPPFSPEKPLGTEFVSRKWGYFCKLCSVSYPSEDATKAQHCRSQTHAENLQRHQQELEQKPKRMSTRKTL